MIKTDYGIYIELKDVEAIIDSRSLYVPIATKKLLLELYNYYIELGDYKSVILLKSGSILENLYLAALDRNIFNESKFSFKPSLVILWDDFVINKTRRR